MIEKRWQIEKKSKNSLDDFWEPITIAFMTNEQANGWLDSASSLLKPDEYSYRKAEIITEINYIPIIFPTGEQEPKTAYYELYTEQVKINKDLRDNLKAVEDGANMWKSKSDDWERIYHEAMARMRNALEKS